MPQLQILNRQPGFGEQLGAALGGGASQGISSLLQNMLAQKQEEAKTASQMKQIKSLFPDAFPETETPTRSSSQIQTSEIPSKQLPSPPKEKQGLAAIPTEQLVAYTGLSGPIANIAKAEMERRKLEDKATQRVAEAHSRVAEKTLISTAERAEALPQKEVALQNMIDAIENKDLGFFTRDNLAEITGIEGLRSPEGAVFKTAGKEFFLGSLKRAGARPNQWIEKQISDMLTKVGRSTEANLSVSEALKTELDIEKKQIELTNQLADEMEAKHGYVKRNLADEVRKELTPYANEKQKQLEQSLKDIKEKYSSFNKDGYLMNDPAGNLRRVSKKDLKNARNAGYKIVQ